MQWWFDLIAVRYSFEFFVGKNNEVMRKKQLNFIELGTMQRNFSES